MCMQLQSRFTNLQEEQHVCLCERGGPALCRAIVVLRVPPALRDLPAPQVPAALPTADTDKQDLSDDFHLIHLKCTMPA